MSGPRRRYRHETAAGVDPGLQPERTTMAWTRTCLALVTISAVFLRWTPLHGALVLALPLLTGAGAVGVLITQRRRTARGVAAIRGAGLSVGPGQPLALMLLLLAVGAAGVAVVLVA